MAVHAEQKMSATEDDTELRDLLIQNLENSGVLNKLKAEMRAAVFLAMDEQDKVENKSPLLNENLKKCLNTKDGRLVASLIIDFLQIFHLDFTLAVFQPEINSLKGLDSREQVSKELGLSEEGKRKTPLLLELLRKGRQKSDFLPEGEKPADISKEPSPRQIAVARGVFDLYDKDRSDSVGKEDLKSVFGDLFPNFDRGMLERFISDDLRTADKSFHKKVDFQEFLRLYKRLFVQCRAVVVQDPGDARLTGDKTNTPLFSKIPRFRGQKQTAQEGRAAQVLEVRPSDTCHRDLGKGDAPSPSSISLSRAPDQEDEEVTEDPDEGDSFFDDPLPRPQKTYGCQSDDEGDMPLSDPAHHQSTGLRTAESSRTRDSPVGSLSERAPTGASCSSGDDSHRDASLGRNGDSIVKALRGTRTSSEKAASQLLDDVEYDDDFNSHRSDISRSEHSIGEEIEEVSIEGPNDSDRVDEDDTQDLSVSQISQSQHADYMEDVA